MSESVARGIPGGCINSKFLPDKFHVRRQVLARWPGGYAFKNITQPGILDRLSLVAGSERSPNRARVCVPYSQSLYRFTQPYPRPASGALTDAEAWKGLRFIDTRRSEDENHSSSKRG